MTTGPALMPGTVAPRRSVLIVDDTCDIRRLLRLVLDGEGSFEVIGEAGDGRAGVRLAGQLQPDAVLLDLAMPVMDGLQALPLIRQVSPQSRVVILSGFNAGQLAAEAMALGADGYIEKGVRPAQLIAKLREFCGDSGSGSGGPPSPAGPRPNGPSGPPGPSSDAPEGIGRTAGDVRVWLEVLFHEVASPLAAVIGFANLLEDGWETMPREVQHRAVAGIGRSARHMRTVLSNFADAGHVELDALDLVLEDTDVSQLVAETVADLAGAASAARVSVVLPGPVYAPVDRTRLRQVVTNLVGNAAKFAGPDAEVVVEVDGDEQTVRVAVADDGPGICVSLQPELFKRYSRAGATGPGKGLGLYVSQGIARAHGGDITVDSDVGRGARFVVRLPRERPAADTVLVNAEA